MPNWVKCVALALAISGCGPGAEDQADGGTQAAPVQTDDGGAPDAGEADAGDPDAGSPDAGEPDAGATPTCSMCHGSVQSPAPPRALDGGTATTDRGVGAHQSHLKTGSAWHRDVQCADCHVVPGTVGDPTHIGTLPAELTFSPLAQQGTTAAWTGTSCTVYCHGATIAGGINKQPAWTTVNGTQAACGTCHSLPPSGKHPAQTSCSGCHGTVMNADDLTFKAPSLHINGVVDR